MAFDIDALWFACLHMAFTSLVSHGPRMISYHLWLRFVCIWCCGNPLQGVMNRLSIPETFVVTP
jgi:hypothetical protein